MILKGAVMLSETSASHSEAEMQSKHPYPSRPLQLPSLKPTALVQSASE